MAPKTGEDVYATLLTSDTYLPGALVLAHSLIDAGTTKKLAVLVTLDTVSAEAITELKTMFDYVLPVPRIKNEAAPANLHLMNRPDLHSAFTKINLWKQAQFHKIVYIDADVVAYRAPDELFDVPHAFAAAPDIGWPDLFNTGVMVLTPDVHEYYALAALAQRGVSFDGADQGLLNMHFRDAYHRLPFTYNVTPSAHYQYLPAYRHFQSSISMVHFIGADKPWFQGRTASTGGGAYDEMVARWWSVYDRHYHPVTPPSTAAQKVPKIVQYFVKGEFQPTITYTLTSAEPSLDIGNTSYGQQFETLPPPPSQSFSAYQVQPLPPSFTFNYPHDAPPPGPYEDSGHDQALSQLQLHDERSHYHHGHHQEHGLSGVDPRSNSPPSFSSQQGTPHPLLSASPSASPSPSASASFSVFKASTHTETRKDQVSGPRPGTSQPPALEQQPHQPSMEPSWDAQWQPPPANAKPEALNFPQTHYEMSHDITPFVPPERYPSPPRDMWYSVPEDAPASVSEKPAPIFPWEAHQPTPTRVFAEAPSGHRAEFSAVADLRSGDLKYEPSTPAMSSTPQALPPYSSDPWATFTHTNAWDDVPQIERYVDSFQKQHRRVRSRNQAPGKLYLDNSDSGSALGGDGTDDDGTGRYRRGSRITDFPSEVERPSLPVTPAPIRRPTLWGGDGPSFGIDEDGAGGQHLLPAAQGVPQQVDWDPLTQLQKLAQKQPELLLEKFGLVGEKEDSGPNGGSGDGGKSKSLPSRPLSYDSGIAQSPTYVAEAPVVSPKPVKPGGQETSSVRDIHSTMSSSDSSGSLQPTVSPFFNSTTMEQPSYLGPGIVFEKDEGLPEKEQTAALPSEEEMDVLFDA